VRPLAVLLGSSHSAQQAGSTPASTLLLARADGDWKAEAVQQREVDVDVEPLRLETGETFGTNYWMLDVDMDCEQGFADSQGRRWFELKAFTVTQLMEAPAPTPGWEGDIRQSSSPSPPYASANHMGICGMINVFVASYPNLPEGLNPNSAQFLEPSYTYLSPIDDRDASDEVLTRRHACRPM
jgi:hypothetical protein